MLLWAFRQIGQDSLVVVVVVAAIAGRSEAEILIAFVATLVGLMWTSWNAGLEHPSPSSSAYCPTRLDTLS